MKLRTPHAYGLAVLASAAALVVNLALQPLIGANTFPLFLVATLLSAWAGGLATGLLGVALTTLFNAYFFLSPESPASALGSASVRLVLYVASAVTTAVLAARLRAVQHRAEAREAEARRHEEERRRSEMLFRALLDSVSDYAIVMLDAGGRIIGWNSGAQRITGYTEADVSGRPVGIFHTEEDAERGAAGRGLDAAARAGRFAEQGWRVRKDGSRFWADVAITASRDAAGRLLGFTKVIHDVTEQRRGEEALARSEARFRSLVELAPDGIVIADASGRIVLANTQAHRMFGYEPGDLVGQAIEVLVPERVRGGHAAYRQDYHLQPRTRPMGAGLDLTGQRRDGSEFPVEISLSPMETEEGLLVTSIVRDVSDRKRVEARVQQLNSDLERRVAELAAVNRELEAFSYSVSHDLRAPLRAIDGFSQAVLEEHGERLGEDGRDYLTRVRAAAQRMAELIDDLLDLSRVTRREMKRQPVDLTAIARAVAQQLQRSDPGRAVHVAIADGVVAEGDGPLLRVVLENLLGNAWKFTGRTPEPRIEFGVTPHDGLPAYFVTDNGVGFDMEYAGKLFGAFQRLHAMHEFPGTGIGLATVQRIVHRHGGHVWAEARPDHGATFYFTLAGGMGKGHERQDDPAGRRQP